jgi:hypothetical protein
MLETNEQIKERLKHQLDGSEQDEEYAAKILCGLEPLDDWSKLIGTDI